MTRLRDPLHSKAPESEPAKETQTEAASDSPAAEVRDLRADGDKMIRLEAEIEDMRQVLLRRQADFENYRKRVERERREDRDRVFARVAESLIPALDNFERALAAHQDPAYEDYRRGFEMIYRQLTDLLARDGIVRMPDPTGQPFDPQVHHALERVETSDYPDGTVIGEVQAGYKIRERVLRPAQVRVAANSTGAGSSPESN